MSRLHLLTFSGRRFIVSLLGSVLFSLLFIFLGGSTHKSHTKVDKKFKQLKDHQQSTAQIQTESSSQGRDDSFKLITNKYRK